MPEKMSTSSQQQNGKKSSNSSIVNTPSSTPLTNIANGNAQANMQNSPPPNNNAPKYGTLVPNRIFVGGISANTTEGELMQLFSNYGTVKAAKIIQDRAGVSKGYGFITFESEDDAKRPLREAENIVLRERKLNIAPAIKKQPFSRTFDASSPSAVAAGNAAQFFFPPGATVPYFQGGVAYYPQPAPAAPGDPSGQQPVYQPPPVYPAQTGPPQAATYPSMMFPAQTIYMPQQYPMPMPFDYNYYQSNGGPPNAQYVVGQGGPGGTAQCGPMPPSSSPPRPPCYSQQMPAYNPADPVFYNLPIYGSAMEGPQIYSESFDLGSAGPYTEDYNMDHGHHQESETPSATVTTTPTTSTNDITHILPPIPPPLPPPFPPPPHPSVITAEKTVANPPEDVQTTRNSNTPVVSLLSIDQQQEKDYLSMQGGRRRKSAPQNNHVQHMYPSNGYINAFPVNYNHHHTHPPHYGPYMNNGPSYANNGPMYNSNNYRRVNGYDNRGNKFNKKRTYDNKNDNSSRSSLRTDSNSSASGVDENKNEEKITQVRSPPPAPYSPMVAQQYRVHVAASAAQTFSQARRNRRSIRRSGSGGVNEIGAGDAPLPPEVGGDVCKKLETLKL